MATLPLVGKRVAFATGISNWGAWAEYAVAEAAACLPRLHRSVMIDGQAHWDGGYAANPAIYPLVLDCRTRDTLLVMLSPLKWAQTPHAAPMPWLPTRSRSGRCAASCS